MLHGWWFSRPLVHMQWSNSSVYVGIKGHFLPSGNLNISCHFMFYIYMMFVEAS